MKTLFLWIILFVYPIVVFADTIIPAGTEVSGNWVVENSPYIILGEAIIPENDTLIIEAGVEVKFKASTDIMWWVNEFGNLVPPVDFTYATLNVGMLRVNGMLDARGTEQDSIIFTRNENEGSWSTIFFTETADTTSILKHCNVEYGNSVFWINDLNYSNFIGSISFHKSKATISDNIIANSKGHIGGAGIYCGENSRPDIIHNYITNNNYHGIYCSKQSHPNIFDNNIVANYDRGILCDDSSTVTIINNKLLDNDYIGIGCRMSSPVIINNTIKNNIWGIDCKLKSDSKIINNLIEGNSIGIFCWENSSPNIINNTIIENSRGIFVQTQSNPGIINTVIWNNNVTAIEIGVNDNNSSYPEVSYSLLQDESLHRQVIDSGNNILNTDPLFETDTYYLKDYSPCVNTGSPHTDDLDLPELDLAGSPRIYGGRIDIGAYENQNQVVGIFDDKNEIYKTNLLENYPNPFNMSTKIIFSLQTASKVKLNIYNIRSQLIKTLINEKLVSGLHIALWNGKDNYGYPVPSGIYFYKIRINSKYSGVNRMILIK